MGLIIGVRWSMHKFGNGGLPFPQAGYTVTADDLENKV